MAYKKGELRACEPRAVLDPSDPEPWEGKVYDARGADVEPPAVELPHSCSAWVIGGPENVKALIEDLQAALLEMEAAKK